MKYCCDELKEGIFNGIQGWWKEVPYEFTTTGELTDVQVKEIRETHKQYDFIPFCGKPRPVGKKDDM